MNEQLFPTAALWKRDQSGHRRILADGDNLIPVSMTTHAKVGHSECAQERFGFEFSIRGCEVQGLTGPPGSGFRVM